MMIKNLLVLFRFCITTYYNLYGLQTLLPVRPTRDYKLDWHAPLLENLINKGHPPKPHLPLLTPF